MGREALVVDEEREEADDERYRRKDELREEADDEIEKKR